jgi:hypothetical protein
MLRIKRRAKIYLSIPRNISSRATFSKLTCSSMLFTGVANRIGKNVAAD